jgi:hypothetical protein
MVGIAGQMAIKAVLGCRGLSYLVVMRPAYRIVPHKESYARATARPFEHAVESGA